MSEEIRVWQVGEADSLIEVKRSKLDLEERIEKWISKDISLLAPHLLIIGQQVETAYGKLIDLLCLDTLGNVVVVELKRDKTPREVTAQALDYASWVKELDADQIEAIAVAHLKGETLEAAFQKRFGLELPEIINEHHAMLVVASEIDDSTERIIRYLSDTYGVDINAVRFQFFEAQDGREFLVRTFTVDLEEVKQNTKRSGSKRIVATAEELMREAENAGVGDLYKNFRDQLSQYLALARRKTVCAFKAMLREQSRYAVVFSIVPKESSTDKGLRYQLYSKRLSDALGVDEKTILSHLPANPQPYAYYANAPDDLRGWAGYVRNKDEIQRFIELLSSRMSSEPSAG